jgi:hypothetical protein
MRSLVIPYTGRWFKWLVPIGGDLGQTVREEPSTSKHEDSLLLFGILRY